MEERSKKKQNIVLIMATIVTVVLTIALLAPFIYVSKFAYPWADDFIYGAEPRAAFLRTGSVIAAVAEAIKVSFATWIDWQGTYTSCFLMALQPAVWNVKLYHLTGVIMLGTLLLAYLILGYVMLHRKLRMDVSSAVIISLLVYIVSVEPVPGIAEGYTWYNSAVHYTFMHSWLIILIALAALISTRKSTKNTFGVICLCILAIIVAGGNNVTTLSGALILFLIEGFALFFGILGKAATGKQYAIRLLPVTVSYLAGFLLNVLAPGNGKRMQASGMSENGNDYVGVIIRAFRVSYLDIIDKFSWELFAVIMIAAGLTFYALLKDGEVQKIEFSFPMPLLVIFASYGLLSAMFCPMLLLAQDQQEMEGIYIKAVEMARTENVVYFSMVMLIIFDVIYLVGWICKKGFLKRASGIVTVAIAAVGIVICVMSCKTKIEDRSQSYITYTAINDIRDQTASYYGYQMAENTRRMTEDGEDVLVMPIAVNPNSLYPYDAADWKEGARLFYNINSVEYESEPYVFTR